MSPGEDNIILGKGQSAPKGGDGGVVPVVFDLGRPRDLQTRRPKNEANEELEARGVERLNGPLSRNASVNHDFIADNFTRSSPAPPPAVAAVAAIDDDDDDDDDDVELTGYLKLTVIAPLAQQRTSLVARSLAN